MKYDIERLEAIPIDDVIVALGGNYKNDRKASNRQFNMHCCNATFHSQDDKKPSLTIWKEKNICKCNVCNIKGNPIAVAKAMHGDSFKEGCEWLHDVFNIPPLEGELKKTHTPKVKKTKPLKKIYFNRNKPYHVIKTIDKYIPLYSSLSKTQKLKLVYTYVYRFSRLTNRERLNQYYHNRGIINNPHLNKIGYLSTEDIITLVKKISKEFPLDDLVEFGILNDVTHKFPLQWKQVKNCLLIPSFDIYSNLIEGFMLRPIDNTNKWFSGKESRLSVPSILKPMPFGVGYKVLSRDCDIYITEGHIDALSLPHDFCFIAAPGVQSFEREQLSILRNRNIKIVFDQDNAGQRAAWGYTEVSIVNTNKHFVILNNKKQNLNARIKSLRSQNIEVITREIKGFRDVLLDAGVASVEVITWDKQYGKDVNDLLVNNTINNVFK